MTLDEAAVAIQDLQNQINDIKTSFLTKIQWKQLDTLRKQQMEAIDTKIDSIETKINNIQIPTIDTTLFVTKTQWKQLDSIRKADFDNLFNSVSELNNTVNTFHNI